VAALLSKSADLNGLPVPASPKTLQFGKAQIPSQATARHLAARRLALRSPAVAIGIAYRCRKRWWDWLIGTRTDKRRWLFVSEREQATTRHGATNLLDAAREPAHGSADIRLPGPSLFPADRPPTCPYLARTWAEFKGL
jgi:hypothetical protein